MTRDRADALFKKANEVLTTDMRGITTDGNLGGENYVSGEFGGLMNPDQFRTFQSWVQDSTVLLQRVRKETLSAPIREIDKMGIGRRVLHGGQEAVALNSSQYAQVDFGKVLLTTTKLMAQLNYSYETVEDNIERGGWQTKVMKELANRVAVDLEELIVMGDMNILPATDDFLCTQDGLIKRAVLQKAGAPWDAPLTGSHWVDAAGGFINYGSWVDLLDSVPGKYWRNRNDYVFLTSPHLELAWREELIKRQTTLGDYFVLTNNSMVSMGIPVITSPHLPDAARVDMATGATTKESTDAGAGSLLFLLNPQNIILGTWRNIMIETERDIERQVYKVVLSMRVGVTLEEPDAIGIVQGLKRDPTPWTPVNGNTP